jgi:DNA-binding transcriptional MerR regulator
MFGIGRLAERTAVPATTLRYYDDLGLVRPVTREAGRRRYDDSAVAQVGAIFVLRDVGFTLAETPRSETPPSGSTSPAASSRNSPPSPPACRWPAPPSSTP